MGHHVRISNTHILIVKLAFGRGYPSLHGAGVVSVVGRLTRCGVVISILSP